MHRFTSLFRLNGSFFANKTCYLSSLCKKKNLKNPRSTRFPRLSITGDERIELPLRVLETPVIPFDQSPLFFYFYFFFLFSLTILRQHSATLYLYHTGIPLSIVFQFLFFTKESGSTATPSSPYLQNCIHSNPSWKFGCRFLSFFFSFSHSHRPLVKPSTD